MGVIRWLDRIDPSTWERAVRRIDEEGSDLLDSAAAAACLRDFGRGPSPETLSTLDDAEDETLHPSLLNGLLEAAVTEAHWELDKSLNRFAALPALLPGGRALHKIIDFKGIDVEVPAVCRDIEGGLYGCCSSAALADCAELARRFRSPADVQAALRQRRPGLVERLLGRGTLATASASELMTQEYYSEYWQTLCDAVLETTTQGHYLGLGMSP